MVFHFLSVCIRVHPWLNTRFAGDDSGPPIILLNVAEEQRRRAETDDAEMFDGPAP